MDGAFTRKVKGQHQLRMPGSVLFLSARRTVGHECTCFHHSNRTYA